MKDLPAVFNVINDQCPIMNDFAKGGDIVNLIFFVAIEFGNEHAKNRSPSFPTPVKQVPNGLRQTFSQAVEMAILFSVVKVVGEIFEILFVVEDSWDDFLYGLGFCKILGILF
jgi:hypothetical protein